MQNIKLHEATKQFNISNKLAMFFLEKHNVPVKSHSSAVSMEQLELLRSFSQDPEKIKETTKEFNKFSKEKKKKPAKEAVVVETEKTIEKKPEVKEEEETPPVVTEKVVEEKKKVEPEKVVEPVPQKPVEKVEEKKVEPVKKVISLKTPAPTIPKPAQKVPERKQSGVDFRKRRFNKRGRHDHRGRGEKRVPEVSTIPESGIKVVY